MAEKTRLRVHGYGDIEVEGLISYLNDLHTAYASIFVFETMLSERYQNGRIYPPSPFAAMFFEQPLRGRGQRVFGRQWPPRLSEILSFIPLSSQLVLSGVRLESPGFWDFVGKLNPLEVLRQYLNDRHERRKDRNYRESAEQRRLELENIARQNQVIAECLKTARDYGASDRDLAPLVNTLLYRPLTALGRNVDRGVIEYAEILGEESKGP